MNLIEKPVFWIKCINTYLKRYGKWTRIKSDFGIICLHTAWYTKHVKGEGYFEISIFSDRKVNLVAMVLLGDQNWKFQVVLESVEKNKTKVKEKW